MSLIEPVGISPDLLRRAQEATAFFAESAAFYRAQSLEAMTAPEGESPQKARDRLHEYRKAALVALEEERRVADEINRARGIHRDWALDLAAARDEVERRLDRLEAEGGAGEVP